MRQSMCNLLGKLLITLIVKITTLENMCNVYVGRNQWQLTLLCGNTVRLISLISIFFKIHENMALINLILFLRLMKLSNMLLAAPHIPHDSVANHKLAFYPVILKSTGGVSAGRALLLRLYF